MHAPSRILIVRPSALGDVCRTVPVLVSLRRAFPDAVIDWVVRDSYIDAIAAHPDLSHAIAFPRGRLANWWWNPATTLAAWRWFAELRRQRYDLVVDCQGLFRSGLMTAVSGATMRIGHADAREFAALAYSNRVSCPPQMHTVERMLRLLDPLGIDIVRDMRLAVVPEAADWWSQQRRHMTGRYAVLAPTSRWASKRWPIERWGQLLQPLRDRGFEHCLVIGAPGEQQQVAALTNAVDPEVNLVGRTTVGQTMAVIAGAGLVIANDSAPLHMAIGFDVPCVGLFGPTNPDEVGPYNAPESVVKGYDADAASPVNFKNAAIGDALMRRIETADVLTRVDSVLDRAESPSECS